MGEYLALERASPASEAQHIHNKAVFDAVNEALGMVLGPLKGWPSAAQRRVSREAVDGPQWAAVVRQEVGNLVAGWCAPVAVDDFDLLLAQDIPYVRPFLPPERRTFTEIVLGEGETQVSGEGPCC